MHNQNLLHAGTDEVIISPQNNSLSRLLLEFIHWQMTWTIFIDEVSYFLFTCIWGEKFVCIWGEKSRSKQLKT